MAFLVLSGRDVKQTAKHENKYMCQLSGKRHQLIHELKRTALRYDTIFVGRVVEVNLIKNDLYQKVKGGKSSKNVPTHEERSARRFRERAARLRLGSIRPRRPDELRLTIKVQLSGIWGLLKLRESKIERIITPLCCYFISLYALIDEF